MKFTIPTQELNAGISTVIKAMGNRTTLSILEGIYVEATWNTLTLRCTDLSLQIETTLPASVTEEGACVMPGRLFSELARRLPDGNYKITGRIKDMIIRGGENIYPKEIEDFIYTHPKVRDVQVIGVPDEQYGEEIMAVVILKEGETSSEEEIKDYVRTHMAKHKVPRYVSFVKEFPMNAAGKILKYKMREDAVELLKLQKANSIVTA